MPPPNWATKLPTEQDANELEVTRPIRQEVKGRQVQPYLRLFPSDLMQGVWETTNIEQKSMKLKDFRKRMLPCKQN